MKNYGICYSKDELTQIIKEQKNKDLQIDNLLKEIMPDIIPTDILSNKFRENNFEAILEKISNLENVIKEQNQKIDKDKITYRYKLQQVETKKYIDQISKMILNISKDCKLQFNDFVKASLDQARIMGEIENKVDYNRVRDNAKDFMYEKMGNQILQFVKEKRKELNQEIYKKKKEEYEQKKLEFQEKKLEQENLKLKRQDSMNVRNLLNNMYEMMFSSNTTIHAKNLRLKQSFKNLSKEAKRAKIKEMKNSTGFDWFEDR